MAFVVAGLYGGAGLALPLGLHWRTYYLVEANIVGTVFAGLVGLAWFIAQLKAMQRRNLLEWTSNLRLLNASEFEWLVGEMFRREGWEVRETGQRDKSDGNIDLELTMPGQRRIVQCKRWTAQLVGVEEIRKFGGTLLRVGLSGRDGLYVTLSEFTEQAEVEAKQMGLTLVDKRDLHARIERVRRSEACPKCSAPMLVDRSSRGWWLRCNQPGCAGKRDLSSDPGRAIELMTKSG